jgi:carbon-monoxide dehydrogenase medium subunit
MKAAAFDYLAPRSLDEALEVLSRHGDGAKLLAGGQSLAPVLARVASRVESVVTTAGARFSSASSGTATATPNS